MIYQALEDVVFVDEQGVPRKVRAGGWIRTPGPDELALNGSPSSFARIDDLDPDILAAAEERVLSTTLNRMKVARYLLAGLLLLWIRKACPKPARLAITAPHGVGLAEGAASWRWHRHMTVVRRPCIVCGRPSPGARCPKHQRPTASRWPDDHGAYDYAWRR